MVSKKLFMCIYLAQFAILEVLSLPGNIQEFPIDSPTFDNGVVFRSRRHAKPPAAPLDPNDNIHHTLDEVNSILGTLGGAGSGAVMGLTGISIVDCGLTFKEEELATMTCPQFIDKVSKCDSMAHLKPQLQQAKQKYKKKPNNKAPCFSKAKKGKRHG